MGKDVFFGKEAMTKMLVGLDKVADTVSGTLGAKGRNVFIDDELTPKITNDGVTIANKIILEDKLENAGGYVIRNVSGQQLDDVGDGTTTVSLLTQAIIHECLIRPENPMVIKDSLKQAGERVLKQLAKSSVAIQKADVEKVALISSEDKHIAHLITEIIGKLGDKAVVNIEDSKTFATEYEVAEGFEAHVGFMSPHFITNKKTSKAVYTDIPVLVSQKKISNLSEIAPIFEMFKKEGIGQCVFVCEDIDDSILGILVQNKLMGTFNSLVIRATAWLNEDIEGATNAIAISDTTGVTFQNFKKEHLGRAEKVICNANTTLFVTSGTGTAKRAKQLEQQAENDPNQWQQKKLQERADKLRGGIAVLKIGASTDFEREYLRFKAEDSVKAVQAALAEGVVEGGGMALWRIAQTLTNKTVGEQILKIALQAPLRKILENAGVDYTECVVNMPSGQGFNVKNERYENLIESGIIDPTKVERMAVENAVSAAATFITTNAIIVDLPQKNERK